VPKGNRWDIMRERNQKETQMRIDEYF
jgi:hypothetical protein